MVSVSDFSHVRSLACGRVSGARPRAHVYECVFALDVSMSGRVGAAGTTGRATGSGTVRRM